MKRLILWSFGALALVLLAMQLVPYGRNHQNPPVVAEPPWDSPQTRALFVRACADCHSNQTRWPWYSHLAPISWQVQRDVEEGRSKLNLSLWGRAKQELDDIPEVIREGSMPPRIYLPTHPEARLSDAEQEGLIRGLVLSLGITEEGGQEKPD
ncbi:MAG: heme-binding domain-containing protein [Meiothermus sp.]|uniref:heme-binding domain-containing protein n=1 Tax=Meiothermus sp. TaxID=1955249 RepID=UPI0025D2C8AB|nr:heme-binding domain-containing protein [Meiothermus sp.]MCS7067598.1 heme-binding domain-containing protein [Meiothermus sp.]MDW8426154.1 heme-binding domain-containing protein [Meiothermus sp.]